jgi:tRNA(Arg) A34 adenosine deaminase TadA
VCKPYAGKTEAARRSIIMRIDTDRITAINSISLTLPDWAIATRDALPTHIPTTIERMAVVIDFARKNYLHQTGGPFAAGVFERDSGRLLAIGVNRVVPLTCSSAHAEIMALSLAQQQLGSFDLGAEGLPAHQLVVSARPCAMCFGAVLWSGVRSLVITDGDDALERITGFDEGPIHPEWRSELARRGIELIEGVLRTEAIELYHAFAAGNHPVYNARRGHTDN